MKYADILRFSISNITHRKLRSWLTIIGIVIGVASVVALVSIGEGAQAQVQSRLGGLGADIITITPGFSRAAGQGGFGGFRGFSEGGRGANLTETNLAIVRATQGVLYADGVVSGRSDMSYLGQTLSVSMQGVDTSVWKLMENTPLATGRYLGQSDSNLIVVGSNIASGAFKQELNINSLATIGGKSFKVIGVLQSTGSNQQDSSVYMPKAVARNILGIDVKQLSSISVKAADASQVDQIAAQIQDNLRIIRHVTQNNQDFTVSTQQTLRQQISSITDTFTLFLMGIASISLLVGGIGITNTMFTSVLERTRQIGVLKALGATESEILKIFVTESGMMGLVGGILGVMFGLVLSGVVSGIGLRLLGAGSTTTVVTPDLIAYSIIFSVAIGTISGIFPARRAAKLEPVEALRYE